MSFMTPPKHTPRGRLSRVARRMPLVSLGMAWTGGAAGAGGHGQVGWWAVPPAVPAGSAGTHPGACMALANVAFAMRSSPARARCTSGACPVVRTGPERPSASLIRGLNELVPVQKRRFFAISAPACAGNRTQTDQPADSLVRRRRVRLRGNPCLP